MKSEVTSAASSTSPDGATATVNGIAVPGTQIIVDGEEILFSKPLGAKG